MGIKDIPLEDRPSDLEDHAASLYSWMPTIWDHIFIALRECNSRYP